MPDPSVFDAAAFKENTNLLPEDDVRMYMRTLMVRCQTLLVALDAPDLAGRAAELADAAHMIAGSAGILGFFAVTDAGRRFARAVSVDAADIVPLTTQLAATLEAAVAFMVTKPEDTVP